MRNPPIFQVPSTAPPLMRQARYRGAEARPRDLTVRPDRGACAWWLAAGRAMSIVPRAAGALRVTEGRLWITVEAPRRGRAHPLGDHFVAAGERIELRAGQHAVVEPYGAAPCAHVAWEPARASAPRQALADLRAAAALAADALRRLLVPRVARRSGCG